MLTMKDYKSPGGGFPTSEEFLAKKVKQGYFPPSIEPYLHLQSFQQFRDVFQAQKIKYGRQNMRFYIRRVNSSNSKYAGLAAVCVQCQKSKQDMGRRKIIVNFDRKTQKIKLAMFDNSHNHNIFNQRYYDFKYTGRGRKTRGTMQQMKMKSSFNRLVQTFPKDIPINQLTNQLMKKYNMSLQTVRYKLYQYRKTNVNFNQIYDLAKLCKLKYYFKIQMEDLEYLYWEDCREILEEPELIMIFHQESEQMLRRAGKIIYLTYLDFKVKGRSQKKWDVLVLSGLTLNYILEPFSFVFVEVSHRNVTNTAIIVDKIFQVLKHKPSVIITPSQQFYDQLFFTLKQKNCFKGKHLYDPLLEIDRIGTTLDRYQDLAYFKTVVLSRTKAEYLNNLQKLMKNCQPTPAIRYNLNRIMKNGPKLIFGLIQTDQYIGTIFQQSGSRKLIEIIKQTLIRFIYKFDADQGMVDPRRDPSIFYLKNVKKSQDRLYNKTTLNRDFLDINYVKFNFSKLTYLKCLKSLMDILSRVSTSVNNSSHYDLKPFQQVVDIPDIISIRHCIKSNLLYVFGEQYGNVFFLDYYVRQEEGQNEKIKTYYIVDKLTKSWFRVAPYPIYTTDGSLNKFIYKCNCLFSFKTGLPCSHEIQAVMLSKSSLFQLFKKQYVVEQKYRINGRPKKTRRNTIK